MSWPRAMLHIAYADALERTRRYSFLVMAAATLYLAYAIGHGDLILKLDAWSGAMNSAWVGGMVATTAIIVVSLFGFYLVKNTIERDTMTGVGQIIAATPVTKSVYLLGKWLSNLAVLSVLLGILAVCAIVLQMVARGGEGIHIVTLMAPFVLLGLPAMSCVAALGVIFEILPWLRGGGGNVLYFFLWSGMLTMAFMIGNVWLDWTGVTIVYRSMGDAVRAVDPSYTGSFNLSAGVVERGTLHAFVWHGIGWTAASVASRVLWVILPALGVVASAMFFHRFDTSRERSKERKAWGRRRTTPDADTQGAVVEGEGAGAFLHLTPGAATRSRHPMIRHAYMEVQVAVSGWPWWWYAGALACIIGGLVSPVADARQYWLPCAWLWPIVLWSGLGTRDIRYLTEPLVFSSPGPVRRQVTALLSAGVAVAVLTGSGVMLNVLLQGDVVGVGAWCAGALFIPSLALALGLWARTPKAFEIIYLLLWYLGPLHPRDLPALDFVGATNASANAGMPVIFAAAAVLFSTLAYGARWYRLRC